MATVRVVYDVASREACDRAAALGRRFAPADFAVSSAPIPHPGEVAKALGRRSADIILLLGDWQTIPVRQVRVALHRRGWRSKLVVGWSAQLPHGLAELLDAEREADGWILADRLYWQTFGRMPNTRVIPHGADPTVYRAECFQTFRDLLADPRRAARRRNLTKDVTAFVTSVGAPTFEACLERLRQQDCTFTMRIIDHVAPMNVAFQRMVDECRTPYYVQVDEDMLLYPHAVRTLVEPISGAPRDVAMAVADLYDVHLERCINGVKIFRHAIIRRYRFENRDRFESALLVRLARDGYQTLRTPFGAAPVDGRTLGLHGVRWTPQSLYERYLTLGRRRRLHGEEWFDAIPGLFLRRYLDDPSAENFLALQGLLAGTLAARTARRRPRTTAPMRVCRASATCRRCSKSSTESRRGHTLQRRESARRTERAKRSPRRRAARPYAATYSRRSARRRARPAPRPAPSTEPHRRSRTPHRLRRCRPRSPQSARHVAPLIADHVVLLQRLQDLLGTLVLRVARRYTVTGRVTANGSAGR